MNRTVTPRQRAESALVDAAVENNLSNTPAHAARVAEAQAWATLEVARQLERLADHVDAVIAAEQGR